MLITFCSYRIRHKDFHLGELQHPLTENSFAEKVVLMDSRGSSHPVYEGKSLITQTTIQTCLR